MSQKNAKARIGYELTYKQKKMNQNNTARNLPGHQQYKVYKIKLLNLK